MNVEMLMISKVFRKKQPQEIVNRATGRVESMYYPIILDDGVDTIDMTVPKDVYENIEEGKIYLFNVRFNDTYRRENQTVRPRIENVLTVIDRDWKEDFTSAFYDTVKDIITGTLPFSDNSESAFNKDNADSKDSNLKEKAAKTTTTK